MEAARTQAPLKLGAEPRGSRYLLRLASDEGLVRRAQSGSEPAFAEIFERYHRPILAFCRHMLGSQEEAEDAVQQTFVAAYRDLLRNERDIALRPWLYRIARNNCITAMRRRQPTAELSDGEPSLVGLSEEVAHRGELRQLLQDLAILPDEQREALVLSELHENSHADVAQILGCEREKVKSLVFQARSALVRAREARELPCEDVRRQLSVLRGGALRKGALGRHVRECDGCRAFSAEVRRQRQQLATLLAVVPSATLKLGAASAMAATAASAATAGSAAGTAAGSGGALAGGAAAGKALLPAALVKGAATVTAVTVLAAGGVAGVERVREVADPAGSPPASAPVDRAPRTGTPAGVPSQGAGPVAKDRDRGARGDDAAARRRMRRGRGVAPGARSRDELGGPRGKPGELRGKREHGAEARGPAVRNRRLDEGAGKRRKPAVAPRRGATDRRPGERLRKRVERRRGEAERRRPRQRAPRKAPAAGEPSGEAPAQEPARLQSADPAPSGGAAASS